MTGKSSELKSLTDEVLLQNRYLLGNLITNGSAIKVYEGKDTERDKRVIIRELPLNGSSNPLKQREQIKQFEEEAELLSSLFHPGLAELWDTFEFNGHKYMVVSLISGEKLSNLIKNSDTLFSDEMILDWAIELCEVLDYLHKRKPEPVIFRGLSPDNVILSEEGKLVLTDSGLSRLFLPFSLISSIERTTRMHYSPMEEYVSRLDIRSDIYSLGAILYFLITREHPVDAFDRGLNCITLPPCRHFNSKISSKLEEIVFKAMALEKVDRYESISDMKKDLLSLKNKDYTDETEGKIKEETEKEKSFFSGIFSLLRRS